MDFLLTRIFITNFRGVTTPVTLELGRLPAGLYFIRGRNELEPRLGSNGAGKSTLFDEAISWALTGKLSRSQRPGSSVENWSKNTAAVTEVRVSFRLDDDEYQVARTRNPNGLFLNSRKVEQSEIDNLLPLTDAALHRTVVIDQFSDLFLSLRPEEKSRMFSEALDLDRWLTAAEKAGEALRHEESQIRETENFITVATATLDALKVQTADLEVESERFEAEKAKALVEAREKAATAAHGAQKAARAEEASRKALAALGGADKRTQADDARRKLREYERALSADRATLTQSERAVTLLERRRESYDKLDDPRCPECGSIITDEHRDTKLKTIDDEIEAEINRIRNTKSDIKDLEIAIMKLEERIETFEEDLKEYIEAVRIDDSHKALSAEAQREKERADHAVAVIENRENAFIRQIDILHVRKGKIEDQLATFRERVVEQQRLVEIYKFWQRGFRDIRLEQLDETLIELEVSANRHAEALGLDGWEVRFATEREKKTGGVSHGFSVLLYPPGQQEPIPFESYSGGESQRWQLAVTFGLAEVLLSRSGISPDFEVLDEPTRGLSTEGIDDLLECLRTRAVETHRRIFFVDHNSLDRGSFDGVITVVKDRTGTYLDDPQGLVSIREQRVRARL